MTKRVRYKEGFFVYDLVNGKVSKLKPMIGEINAMKIAKGLFDKGYRKVDNGSL